MFATATQKDPTFWFDDVNIVLQAESTTFKLPRSLLRRESEFFAAMYDLDQYPPAAGQDGTEERPLLLLEIPATAFSNILRMLYTVWGAELEFDTEELVGILRASHRLLFTNVHTVVVKLLRLRLGSERRLHLGIAQCGVDDWAFPAFSELVHAYDARPADCDPPLLPFLVWGTIYDLRSRIQRGRISTASVISNTYWSPGLHQHSCLSQCPLHGQELWQLMTGEGEAAEIMNRIRAMQERIRKESKELCTCHSSGSDLFAVLSDLFAGLNPPKTLDSALNELQREDQWLRSAWASVIQAGS